MASWDERGKKRGKEREGDLGRGRAARMKREGERKKKKEEGARARPKSGSTIWAAQFGRERMGEISRLGQTDRGERERMSLGVGFGIFVCKLKYECNIHRTILFNLEN